MPAEKKHGHASCSALSPLAGNCMAMLAGRVLSSLLAGNHMASLARPCWKNTYPTGQEAAHLPGHYHKRGRQKSFAKSYPPSWPQANRHTHLMCARPSVRRWCIPTHCLLTESLGTVRCMHSLLCVSGQEGDDLAELFLPRKLPLSSKERLWQPA